MSSPVGHVNEPATLASAARPVDTYKPATAEPNHRSNNIDAIRLILAFLVLFSHSYPLALGREDTEPLKRFSRGQITLGNVAVDAFFILSGYLITQSWLRSSRAWSFFKKRVARIYPGLLVAMAVCVWVILPLASDRGGEVYTAGSVLSNGWRFLALEAWDVPPVFMHNPAKGVMNGSLWSIKFELLCYLGVMALGITTLLTRRAWLVALFATLILVHLAFAMTGYRPGGRLLGRIFGSPVAWALLLPLYLSGVLAYLHRYRYTLNVKGTLICLVGLLVAARIPHAMVIAMPTLGTYLLLYLCFTDDWKWHNAAAHGDFSFGVYLYAFPIQQLIMHWIGRPIPPLLLFALAAPPSLLAGYLSWHLVEKWFLKKATGRSPSRNTAIDPVGDIAWKSPGAASTS